MRIEYKIRKNHLSSALCPALFEVYPFYWPQQSIPHFKIHLSFPPLFQLILLQCHLFVHIIGIITLKGFKLGLCLHRLRRPNYFILGALCLVLSLGKLILLNFYEGFIRLQCLLGFFAPECIIFCPISELKEGTIDFEAGFLLGMYSCLLLMLQFNTFS